MLKHPVSRPGGHTRLSAGASPGNLFGKAPPRRGRTMNKVVVVRPSRRSRRETERSIRQGCIVAVSMV